MNTGSFDVRRCHGIGTHASVVRERQRRRGSEVLAEHIPDSAVTSVFTARADPASPVAEVVEFTVAGHEVIGLSAGPAFHLDDAFSFYLRVEGQDEVDRYWDILTTDGGEPGP